MYLGAKIEGRRTADFILAEGNGSISRDVVTIAQSGAIGPGTVLGKVTVNGKFKVLDLAANDGTEVAAAVLYASVDATAGDVTDAVALVRDAELKVHQLVWPNGITEGETKTATDELTALGLIAR